MKRATNSINKKLPTVAGKSEPIIKTIRSGRGSGHTFSRSTKVILIALLMILMVLSYNMYYDIQKSDENKSIMKVKEENPSSTAGVEVKEPEKKKDPLEGWIYEPKNELDYVANVQANPIFFNGKVYTPNSQNEIISLDAINGEVKWKYRVNDGIAAKRGLIIHTFKNTPILFFTNNRGLLFSLNADTGKIIKN